MSRKGFVPTIITAATPKWENEKDEFDIHFEDYHSLDKIGTEKKQKKISGSSDYGTLNVILPIYRNSLRVDDSRASV